MPCYRTLVVRDPAGRPHFPRGLSFCRLHFPRGLSFCRPNGFASTARGSVLLSPQRIRLHCQEVCPFVAPQRIRLHCQGVCPFVAPTDSPPLPGGLSFCRPVAPFQEVCPFVAPRRSVHLSPQRIRLHCQEVCPFVALLPLSRRSVLLSPTRNGFASTARRSVLLSPTQRIRLHCQEVCPFVAYGWHWTNLLVSRAATEPASDPAVCVYREWSVGWGVCRAGR
jgi:hypothetical protein